MDPYSHTPGHAGARQPGLTGQVKEDILCRAGELGVFVEEGQIRFRPLLLRRQEFLAAPARFSYFDISGAERRLRLEPGSLAFTFCQAPVVYQLAKESGVAVFRANGAVARQAGLRLDAATSRLIFERTGEVKTVWVSLRA